ncbi:MAG: prepilin-type N-terminal cleavage/methylation domain-containing protein [Candidatus Paceibacterota bacterium]|jgi:prepilin-type N-terminal cleavage/methylation domain-containing protein
MPQIIRKAFTLIELLVVIAIIGILSGMIVISMGGVTNKATIAKTQVFSNSLRNSLMANIIGEWKMDEGSGTAANDSWSKNNNGTLSGFADTTAGYGDTHTSGWMSSSNCISGTCLKFDGVDDYVSLSSAISTTARTQAGWFYFSQVATVKGGQISTFSNLYQHNANNYLYINSTGDYFNAGITTAGWYHLALVFSDKTNDANAVLYVNGVVKNINQQTGVHTIPVVSYIGVPSTATLLGYADDVRIYDTVIPTSQIQEQYYAGLNSLLASGQITKQEYQNRLVGKK